MSSHVLLENDKARIVDTRAMEWADPLPQEPLHGVPGAKVKVLARFESEVTDVLVRTLKLDADAQFGHEERDGG